MNTIKKRVHLVLVIRIRIYAQRDLLIYSEQITFSNPKKRSDRAIKRHLLHSDGRIVTANYTG